MLPSGICQVLPASQRAVKLSWHWLDFPLTPLYHLAIVLLSGLCGLFCDSVTISSLCIRRRDTWTRRQTCGVFQTQGMQQQENQTREVTEIFHVDQITI